MPHTTVAAISYYARFVVFEIFDRLSTLFLEITDVAHDSLYVRFHTAAYGAKRYVGQLGSTLEYLSRTSHAPLRFSKTSSYVPVETMPVVFAAENRLSSVELQDS